MKKLITVFFCYVMFLLSASAQTGEYSSLVVKQIVKVPSYTMNVQITHYLGNGVEKDFTKTKNGVKFNELLDVLNDLKKLGWRVIGITTHTNLLEEDVKVGFTPINTNYIQYLLVKD